MKHLYTEQIMPTCKLQHASLCFSQCEWHRHCGSEKHKQGHHKHATLHYKVVCKTKWYIRYKATVELLIYILQHKIRYNASWKGKQNRHTWFLNKWGVLKKEDRRIIQQTSKPSWAFRSFVCITKVIEFLWLIIIKITCHEAPKRI